MFALARYGPIGSSRSAARGGSSDIHAAQVLNVAAIQDRLRGIQLRLRGERARVTVDHPVGACRLVFACPCHPLRSAVAPPRSAQREVLLPGVFVQVDGVFEAGKERGPEIIEGARRDGGFIVGGLGEEDFAAVGVIADAARKVDGDAEEAAFGFDHIAVVEAAADLDRHIGGVTAGDFGLGGDGMPESIIDGIERENEAIAESADDASGVGRRVADSLGEEGEDVVGAGIAKLAREPQRPGNVDEEDRAGNRLERLASCLHEKGLRGQGRTVSAVCRV